MSNADGYEIEENDAFSCGQGGAGGSGAGGSGASGSEEGARGDCDSWFHLASKGAGDTSHTVTGLTHGLTYSYRIRSYRTLAGSTDYSTYSYAGTTVPTATATPTATTPPTTPPPPPTTPPPPTPGSTPTPGPTRGCKDDPLGLLVLDNPSGDYFRAGEIDYPDPDDGGTPHWTSNCRSPENDQVYAVFYRFTLANEWHLTIDLHALDSQDAVLRVKRSDSTLQEDDNGYPDSASGTDSRMARRFGAGTYIIEATMKEELTGGTFKLKIDGEVPIDGWAHVHTYIPVHQGDYTVQYKLGEMVQPHIPNDPSDPAIVIPAAIVNAVNAWNDAVAGTWPDVLFCKEGACPAGRNAADGDGWLTTVHVVDGKTSPRQCLSIACIRPKPTLDPDRHLLNMEIVIESPPYALGTLVTWTTNPARDENVPGGVRGYRHLPTAVMHEFGHAAGLEDLYLPDYAGKCPGYLMDKAVVTAIPEKDRDYLRQIYRNEHGSEPH